MHVICLTIGRNVAETPMPEQEWTEFCAATRQWVRTLPADTIETHTGNGTWGEIREESYKVTALCSHQPSVADMDNLQHGARLLAERFHQDAIALTIGWSSLITPEIRSLTHINQEVFA